MKISTTLKAWLPDHETDIGPKELTDPKNIGRLHFTNVDMAKGAGWTLVGTAVITVDMVDQQTLVANKVDALRNELSAVRAKAHMEATRIEGRINDLLCLTFDAAVES